MYDIKSYYNQVNSHHFAFSGVVLITYLINRQRMLY